jgi:peptidoglycan/xylan/chitin deacetylase (PgdA/CDA1 family)
LVAFRPLAASREGMLSCSTSDRSSSIAQHQRERGETRVSNGLVENERLKRTLEAALAWSIPPREQSRRVVVLCYHSIHPHKAIRSVTPSIFEQQIEWLEEHCRIVPFASISGEVRVPSGGNEPIVAITFDDGYQDNHEYALPTLSARGIPAAVFLTTGLVDREPDVVQRFAAAWHVPEEQVRGMSWSQVLEMRAAGFEIGVHTRTHPVLGSMTPSAVRDEILESKARIEDQLGAEAPMFAYPFGQPRVHLTTRTRDVVESLGFTSAATILYRGVRSDDDPLMVPRFPITQDSMRIFIGKVTGKLDSIGAWQTHAPNWAARIVTPRRSRSAPRSASVPPTTSGDPGSAVVDPLSDQIALPWARSPRWIIPRQPPRLTRAGLDIHHPVTFRSRIGWEMTRALAGRGMFRSLPRYPLIPREVSEVVAGVIPVGGSVSVAAANHPGRFLALVLDRAARPVLFVKVARDSVGSRALAHERDALLRAAHELPSPLLAPRLVDEFEGALVFEAFEWEPRAFPWKLPVEVAFAMGSFYRKTSADQGRTGAAHGDFAPWNLLRLETGWALVDWEGFLPQAPPFFDLFHYFVQSMISGMKKPRASSILEGLDGTGWIGEAIQAYADGSGVDIRRARHSLTEYLRTSVERLGIQLGPRGVRRRAELARRLESR